MSRRMVKKDIFDPLPRRAKTRLFRSESAMNRWVVLSLYVNPLSEARTKPGKGRIGCRKTFFTILP